MTISFRKQILFMSSLILVLAFTFSCGNNKRIDSKESNATKNDNPLDSIFGDKIQNLKTNEVRKDNFGRLIGIKKNQLVLESKLYNIEEVKPNYYILKQKRCYSEARYFNILLKTNENEIIDFIAFNDFSISDLKFDSASLIVLLSNLNQTNEYWKNKQQIQIIKLDTNFNKIWNFTRKSNYPPLNGQDITIGKNEYSFKIEVITGCHICYVVTKLTLTKNGEFKSIRSIEKHNSEDISENILFNIFAKP